MPEDFREQRRQRQQGQTQPTQGVVVPENVYQLPDSETVKPENRQSVPSGDDQVIKTSFYPTQAQLDKLDDLAGEYNKRYRRQRKKIDRQDIIRYLIDKCDLEALTKLQI